MNMDIIIILLAILALTGIVRLYLVLRPEGKRRYFKSKLSGAKKMIWDLEFKRFKTSEVREEIRKEYDQSQSGLVSLQQSYENFPKDGDPEEKARIKDKIILTERDIERFKKQMDALDLEINGSKPTHELPNGHSGLTDQIDSLRELVLMIKSWIKSI